MEQHRGLLNEGLLLKMQKLGQGYHILTRHEVFQVWCGDEDQMKIVLKDREITLPDDWKEQMECLALEGKNYIIWLKELKISKNNHYLMIKENQEYAEHIEKCIILHDSWWLENLRSNMTTRGFNAFAWKFYACNNLGYKDKPIDNESSPVRGTKKEKEDVVGRYMKNTLPKEEEELAN